MEVPSGGSWSYGLDVQLSPQDFSYHPLRYKTMACPEFRRGVCKRGENCAKRHIDVFGVDHDAYYCKEFMPWYPGMRRK
jgi:hypothetical protein